MGKAHWLAGGLPPDRQWFRVQRGQSSDSRPLASGIPVDSTGASRQLIARLTPRGEVSRMQASALGAR